jgi:PilZ domain
MTVPFGRPYAFAVPTAQPCRERTSQRNPTQTIGSSRSRPERRSMRRTPSRLMMRACLSHVSEEGVWLATIRNISQEGIGLTTNRPVKIGMFLTVELPGRPPIMRKSVLVRVTHSHALAGHKWWNVGGAFVQHLTREDLDSLKGDAPVLSPPHEQRTSMRHTTKFKSACPLVRATEEGPWWATVRNVSRHGIGLIADRPFRVGAFIALALPTAEGKVGRERLLKITHLTAQSGNHWWVLGGSFLTRLWSGTLVFFRTRCEWARELNAER